MHLHIRISLRIYSDKMDSFNHQMKLFLVGILTGVCIMNYLLGYIDGECVYDLHSNTERPEIIYSILKTCVHLKHKKVLSSERVYVEKMNCSRRDRKLQTVQHNDVLTALDLAHNVNWVTLSVNSVVNTQAINRLLVQVTTRFPVVMVHPHCHMPSVLVANRKALVMLKNQQLEDINYCELRNITVINLKTAWKHRIKKKSVESHRSTTLVFPFRKDNINNVFLQYEQERMKFLYQKLIFLSNDIRNVYLYHQTSKKPDPGTVNTQEWNFINNSFVHSTYNFNGQAKESAFNRGRYGALESSVQSLPGHLKCKPKFAYQRFSANDGIVHEIKCANGTQRYRLHCPFEGVRFREQKVTGDRPIVIILTLFKRSSILERFLKRLQSLSYDYQGMLILRIMLFKDKARDYSKTIQLASNPWGNIAVEVIKTKGKFSRSKGIAKGVEDLEDDSLVLIMDVDMMFTVKFLRQIVQMTIRGKQVYFPIYFSRFDPNTVLYRNGSCLACKRHVFSQHLGLWRHFSYGIVGVYKSDVDKVGSFNNNIKGWGMEDVEFFNRCIEINLSVFRAVEPELWHMYHPRFCDPSLPADRLLMCYKSRLELQSSQSSLADYVLRFSD